MQIRDGWEQFGHRVMSGEANGLAALALRSALGVAEPFYAGVMRLRNEMYDAGLRTSRALGRPTISVGNITAGGTGKTPVVRWLAGRLFASGQLPAILLRGYKSSGSERSDEQQLLERHLNSDGEQRVIVHAQPSRVEGARAVLRNHQAVTVFILDDGFQHRKARRDLDIVLINAAEPFGYNHVHPRGLLREPLKGVARAHAVVLTHADEVALQRLEQIEQRIRQYHGDVPVYRCRHVQTGLRTASRAANLSPDVPMDELRRRRFFAASGIGSPRSLQRQLSMGFDGTFVGFHWFGDHHRYTSADLSSLRERAGAVGAEVIVVTEKDWVKLQPLNRPEDEHRLPILRLDMEIRFEGEQEQQLFGQVMAAVVKAPAATQAADSTAAGADSTEGSARAPAGR